MNKKKLSLKILFVILVLIFAISACASSNSGRSQTFSGIFRKPSMTPVNLQTKTLEQPTQTPLPTEIPSPTLTPAPKIVEVSAGKDLTIPILLYHHVSNDKPGNRYYISLDTFDSQLKWLYDNHYQTVTVKQVADLILYGGQMPERPVVITFDDGDEDMITNALPIMQKYGFIGTAYLIVSWIDVPEYISSDQVMTLKDAGWEIGSHSMSHVDLTQNKQDLPYEIEYSLSVLNQRFDLDVKTFSYPFGLIDADVANSVSRSGYIAGVGLGTSITQRLREVYYMSRLEVRQEYSMEQFIAMLPWHN